MGGLYNASNCIHLNSANDPMNAGQHNADHAADAGRLCLCFVNGILESIISPSVSLSDLVDVDATLYDLV